MARGKPGKGQTALVTGASSGIGRELAGCFAAGGFDLVLVARSSGKIRELASELAARHGIRAAAMPCDLSRSGSAAKLAASAQRRELAVDVLVNCAGVLEHGSFAGIDATRHQELIDLNISGLTAMLAQFLPPMIGRGRGRVLNVASIAAFQPIPALATYAATKAYVLSLSESLAEELKGKGITVCALCPGLTATGMLTAAQQSESLLKRVPGFLISDAATVAAQGYKACMRGDVICVPGPINLATAVAGRSTPKWMVRRLTGAIGRRSTTR
jgi:short-subunit dehydrogenase